MTPTSQQEQLHALLSMGDFPGVKNLLGAGDLSTLYSKASLLNALLWASDNGEAQCVADLLAACGSSPQAARHHSDHSPSIAAALESAAIKGFEACVTLLAAAGPHVDDIARALMCAAKNGHLSCVEALIPLCDPAASDAQALVWAAESGHLACAQRLLPLSLASAGVWQALIEASGNGHAACVRLLLPHCDPLREDSLALRWAAWEGRGEIVEILLPHSDPKAFSEQGHDAIATALNAGHDDIANLIEFFLATQERDAILESLSSPSAIAQKPRL